MSESVRRVADILMAHGLNAPESQIHKAARAVIESLHSPSLEMIRAGKNEVGNDPVATVMCWQAMLREAVKD